GTYPLPEAQLDRFAMKFSLGYVSNAQEVAILSSQGKQHPLDRLKTCITLDEMQFLQAQVKQVRISEELKHYIVAIVSATRNKAEIKLGASPRASLTLMKTSQALALLDGFEFVTPDVIKELAVPVIAHRLNVDSQSKFSGIEAAALMQEIVDSLPMPS
ncbi:MAG: AAA family ATPase, partial [Methylobacter sp.]